MVAIGVIPARYGSKRFVGKPLAEILGKPMIQWVYEGARRSELLSDLIIATDDERIKAAVEAFGAKVQMTSPRHPSGTDRVAEVAGRFECDVVVNIQGDEPLIEGWLIDRLVDAFADPAVDMATLAAPLTDAADYTDPDVVKIVCTHDGFALYFSRAPIPHFRDAAYGLGAGSDVPYGVLQHIGIYAYRREFLLKLVDHEPTFLEQAEKLEQLRALELGYRIKVVRVEKHLVDVDREEDIAEVERILRERLDEG